MLNANNLFIMERGISMNSLAKGFGVSVASLSLLLGATTAVLGQGAGVGGGMSSGVSSAGAKGLLKLRASVVCVNCSLEEARAARPDATDLYELSHDKGKVVIRVNSVNETTSNDDSKDVSTRWASVSKPPHLTVRAEDSLIQKLMDEKNRTKEMEITGVIRTTRTLDIADITVLG
jgi:hypothetical protein